MGALPTAAILLTTPPKGGRAGRFHTAIHIKKHFCWSTDPQTAFSDRKPLAERRQRFPAGPLLHTIRSALHRTGMLLLHEPQRGRAFTNARNAERSDAKPKRGPQGELVTPAPQRAWNPPPMAAIKSGDMRVGFDSLRLCKCRQRRRAVKGRAVAQPQAGSAEPLRQKSADFWRGAERLTRTPSAPPGSVPCTPAHGSRYGRCRSCADMRAGGHRSCSGYNAGLRTSESSAA